jgi:hypothetical protein
MRRMLFLFSIVMLLNSLEGAAQLHLKDIEDTAGKPVSIMLLPQNFYKQSLGYFCKKEIQLQKTTMLPLFIRLGSKEYVDYLERKPNAILK